MPELFSCPECGCLRFVTQRAVLQNTNIFVIFTRCNDDGMQGCGWMRRCLQAVETNVETISNNCQVNEALRLE